VFYNVKIVGNRSIPPPHIALMDQSVLNAIVLIKLNIIGISLGVAKQISK